MIQTNWYVITGGPGCGKTTSIDLLAASGYKTTIEHARHYIDTKRQAGLTVEQIRKNQEEFQMGVLQMQIEQESSLSPSDIVFLDRALPDALAYYHFLGLKPNQTLLDAMNIYRYRKVFILDLLPIVQDYARREDETAQKKIHHLLVEVYTSMKFEVVKVPVSPPRERVDLILSTIGEERSKL
jgi:predicted ATPase